MFTPDQSQVRRFFCEAWRKHTQGAPQSPVEALAAKWIAHHPEYHGDLSDVERAIQADYQPSSGRENPFLHLALHLSVQEQLSIDQPVGIRAAHDALLARTGSEHAAAHALMECLAEALWQAQRSGQPLDAPAYRHALARAAGLPNQH